MSKRSIRVLGLQCQTRRQQTEARGSVQDSVQCSNRARQTGKHGRQARHFKTVNQGCCNIESLRAFPSIIAHAYHDAVILIITSVSPVPFSVVVFIQRERGSVERDVRSQAEACATATRYKRGTSNPIKIIGNWYKVHDVSVLRSFLSCQLVQFIITLVQNNRVLNLKRKRQLSFLYLFIFYMLQVLLIAEFCLLSRKIYLSHDFCLFILVYCVQTPGLFLFFVPPNVTTRPLLLSSNGKKSKFISQIYEEPVDHSNVCICPCCIHIMRLKWHKP